MTAVQRDLLELLVIDLLDHMAEEGLLNPSELAAAKRLAASKGKI